MSKGKDNFKLFVANILRDARERGGIPKQKDMASKLSLTQATVSGYESGDNYASTKTLSDYAEALDMDLEINFIKRKK